MSRLVGKDENGSVYLLKCWEGNGCKNANTEKCRNCQHDYAVYEKCYSYEDSGLTPAEVSELAKTKTEGRLAILSCTIGTKVFEVIGVCVDKGVNSKLKPIRGRSKSITIWTIHERTIKSITVGLPDGIHYGTGYGAYFLERDIGKRIFFTREEAEEVQRREK